METGQWSLLRQSASVGHSGAVDVGGGQCRLTQRLSLDKLHHMATATKNVRRIIGLKELRENMSTYIKHTEAGKSFTVVRRSRPIFRLVPVDEWGDEGTWETVLDFRKINPRGVPIDDVIASLERLNAQDR